MELIKRIIHKNSVVMLYFSTPSCNVCHALRPKLFNAVKKNFKECEIVSIDISIDAEIAAYFNVFAIPTILIFLDGKEFLKKSRYMSVDEVIQKIKRPYEIMFS